MKLKTLPIAMLALASLFAGCSEHTDYSDVVFITGTEEQTTMSFLLDGDEGAMNVSVTSTAKLDADAHLSMRVAPEMLTAYNAEHGYDYKMLPEGSYTFDNPDVTITKGQSVSSQATLHIVSTENFEEGATYCVPVTISQDGGMKVLESERSAFIVINRVLRTKAANMSGMYYSVPSWIGNSDVAALSQLTMECKVYVVSFASSSPYISSVMGIEEDFLLRFGDVSCDPDQLQLAAGKTGVTDGNPDHGTAHPQTYDMHFSTGKWYHLALVYDGSNIVMYVDGKSIGSVGATGAVCLSWDYMDGFHLGRSERGRYLNGYMSEARVWNKALTPGEIQSHVCHVDPSSEGLLAYWRLNGEDVSGNTVKDLTGHGYDLKASSTPKWVTNQPCPF